MWAWTSGEGLKKYTQIQQEDEKSIGYGPYDMALALFA